MGKSKASLYKILIERLELALSMGFYLEACWLAHAIFEDRTRSIVANSGDGTEHSKSLATKIATIKERFEKTKTLVVNGKTVKNKKSGQKEKIPKWHKLHTVDIRVFDRLDKWRQDRNDLAHGLATGEMTHDQILDASKELAERAKTLTREVCAAARRVKKHATLASAQNAEITD